MIPPLLKRVKQLASLNSPPPAHVGCRDCQQVDRIVELLAADKEKRA